VSSNARPIGRSPSASPRRSNRRRWRPRPRDPGSSNPSGHPPSRPPPRLPAVLSRRHPPRLSRRRRNLAVYPTRWLSRAPGRRPPERPSPRPCAPCPAPSRGHPPPRLPRRPLLPRHRPSPQTCRSRRSTEQYVGRWIGAPLIFEPRSRTDRSRLQDAHATRSLRSERPAESKMARAGSRPASRTPDPCRRCVSSSATS